MNILGIETSCDETAASIVQDGSKIMASSLATSQELHTKSGGIIPEEAARKQVEFIIPVIENTINKSGLSPEKLDAIAVTYGPGLIGSLLIGVETAKTLSYLWDRPIIPVNHLKAHIYACWIDNDTPPEFPVVVLVVSGGHTDFVYLKSHEDIEYIGGTRDDAAGECFDKCARIIGLPYPGGPAIAKEANRLLSTDHSKYDLFPRPMVDSDDLEMSFSGLKTAVLNYVKNKMNTDSSAKLEMANNEVSFIAANIQAAIVDTLLNKITKAVEKYKPNSFILAGGVSANSHFRERLSLKFSKSYKDINLFTPNAKYSTDNAVMIASCANYNYSPVPWHSIAANPQLAIEE